MSSISASLVSQFVSFTGASAAEASMFLEMAGNNVEVAVGLFFGGGGGFGGGDSAAAAAGAAAGGGGGESEQPAFAKLCFGASCSAPPRGAHRGTSPCHPGQAPRSLPTLLPLVAGQEEASSPFLARSSKHGPPKRQPRPARRRRPVWLGPAPEQLP